MSLLPSEMPPTPVELWQPTAGDTFVVDTKNNNGYLVHKDGGYVMFPVATGQRRVVRYIGRTYKAVTPVGNWEALSRETKGDHTTFGKDGTFYRLFDEDGETAYGIHAHRSIDAMLADPGTERFRSMGCILVSYQVLEKIGQTFDVTNSKMPVFTVFGFSEESVTAPVLLQTISEHTPQKSVQAADMTAGLAEF